MLGKCPWQQEFRCFEPLLDDNYVRSSKQTDMIPRPGITRMPAAARTDTQVTELAQGKAPEKKNRDEARATQ